MVSAPDNARTSLQEHPINPVCSFDEYVDIDLSATIEQPNNLQPELTDADLQPSVHSPVYNGLFGAIDEDDSKMKSNETAYDAQLFNSHIRSPDKENIVFDSKSRKFSLQELKSKENENRDGNKKRNKSFPALLEYNTKDKPTSTSQPQLHDVVTEKQMQKNITQDKQGCAAPEKRLKSLEDDEIKNSKVSSLRSVLLEADAYENIEIVKKQKSDRATVATMKGQEIQKEPKLITVRRAFSEQTRSPMAQPRKIYPKKRKTFDPYDYPPGVPIPKALLESDEETADSEYVPHYPSTNETTSAKRKTFDPYDYPPGVPIPKALLDAGNPDENYPGDMGIEDNDVFENDAQYAFIESSGVYVAFDPDNDDQSKPSEAARNEYVNISSAEDSQNNFENNYKQMKTSSREVVSSNDPSPPKPCSVPYYVNECVSVIDHDKDVLNEIRFVNGNNSDHSTKSDLHESDNDPDRNNQNVVEFRNQKDIYQNVSVSESDLHETVDRTGDNNAKLSVKDKNAVYKNTSGSKNQTKINANIDHSIPVTSGITKEKNDNNDVSKSEKNIQVAASNELRRYRSDDGGIYQNLAPSKPPRLHNSTGQFDKPNNDEDENKHNDYEDVLVKQKRPKTKNDAKPEYMNMK